MSNKRQTIVQWTQSFATWSIMLILTIYYIWNIIYFLTNEKITTNEPKFAIYDTASRDFVLPLAEKDAFITHDKQPHSSPPSNATDSCSIIKPKICNLSKPKECVETCGNRYSCVRFNRDERVILQNGTVSTLKLLTNPNQGYCLQYHVDVNKGVCSAKRGGRWTLHEYRKGALTFLCECTQTDLFTRTSITGDCDHFEKCRNRPNNALTDDWTNFTNLACSCNYDETFVGYSDGGPKCVEANFFQATYDRKQMFAESEIEHDYAFLPIDCISLTYIKRYFTSEEQFRKKRPKGLPNPCTYDAFTNELVPQHYSNRVGYKWHNGILHCYSNVADYRTIRFTDDYLRGNQGLLANGIIRVTKRNDKNDVPLKKMNPIYETHTIDQTSGNVFPIMQGYIFETRELSNVLLPMLSELTDGLPPFESSSNITKIIIFNFPDPDVTIERQNVKESKKIMQQRWCNVFIHVMAKEQTFFTACQLRQEVRDNRNVDYLVYVQNDTRFHQRTTKVKPLPGLFKDSSILNYTDLLYMTARNEIAVNHTSQSFTGQIVIYSQKGIGAAVVTKNTALIEAYRQATKNLPLPLWSGDDGQRRLERSTLKTNPSIPVRRLSFSDYDIVTSQMQHSCVEYDNLFEPLPIINDTVKCASMLDSEQLDWHNPGILAEYISLPGEDSYLLIVRMV